MQRNVKRADYPCNTHFVAIVAKRFLAAKCRTRQKAPTRGRPATLHPELAKSGQPPAIQARHNSGAHGPEMYRRVLLRQDDKRFSPHWKLKAVNKSVRHTTAGTRVPQRVPLVLQARRSSPPNSYFGSALRWSLPSFLTLRRQSPGVNATVRREFRRSHPPFRSSRIS
jgi:hypothetical protein